jgi:OOP family OmpA-OmpF porin
MRCLLGPLLPVLLLVAGCATPQGSVVLLPERDGKDSAVVVSQGTQQLVLSQPYAGAGLSSRGPEARQWDPQAVRSQFGAALYFVEGKDEFTEESKRVIDGIFAEIAKRAVPDVVVIGHTDRLGTDAYNDALSRQRAEVVRSALLTRGIAVDKVVAIGRGKREPVVPTADGVAEPRNRRVEIQVR